MPLAARVVVLGWSLHLLSCLYQQRTALHVMDHGRSCPRPFIALSSNSLNSTHWRPGKLKSRAKANTEALSLRLGAHPHWTLFYKDCIVSSWEHFSCFVPTWLRWRKFPLEIGIQELKFHLETRGIPEEVAAAVTHSEPLCLTQDDVNFFQW